MKVINISKMDKQNIQNALNEVRILSSIEHDNIVAYKESFLSESSEEMFIVMEFVGGGDLSSKIKDLLRNRQRLNEKLIWKYLCQILLGLHTLHENKIIHRDIKTANLFLNEDFSTLKIGDLNVSKVAKNDLAITQIGTPYYLAPEIWDNKIYDYKCDIYSLGVVLYELAALKLPFEGSSLHDLYRRVKLGQIKRIPNCYSNDLFSMILLLMNQNQRLRPSTSELLENPLIKEHLESFEYKIPRRDNELNLKKTIVIPRNLLLLKNQLPNEKKYQRRAESVKKI